MCSEGDSAECGWEAAAKKEIKLNRDRGVADVVFATFDCIY